MPDYSQLLTLAKEDLKSLQEAKEAILNALNRQPEMVILNDQIKHTTEAINNLKAICPHNHKTGTEGHSDGSYYNSSRDWTDWYCPDCGKTWETPR